MMAKVYTILIECLSGCLCMEINLAHGIAKGFAEG